ncbi:MAG: redoxin domain-containing protein [Phycisphaerae bacterium]|nr:redoxin domain-containing protein [Phycisphaerae bacterium]
MFKAIVTLSITALVATPALAQNSVRPLDTTPKEDKKTVEVGEQAPAFELVDQNGKTHTLQEYEGKIVVLEWFNETCPYCKGTWGSGLIPKLLTDLQEHKAEVVYLAVNSSANRPEDKIVESGKEFLEEFEIEIPILNDYNGKVGRAYKARTTPHMFVIDAEGILVYQGALSDDSRSKEGAEADTHILRVVTQIDAGEEVSPSYVQPWGCPVKYARDGDRGRGNRDGKSGRGGKGGRGSGSGPK